MFHGALSLIGDLILMGKGLETYRTIKVNFPWYRFNNICVNTMNM